MTDERLPDITISIINTNNREVALACLETVYATAGDLTLQVVVVDNACTDGSADEIRRRFPEAELIENEQMLGFSTNNNLALGRARGRYWMLLNDDTLVQPGAFQAMVRFMDDNPQAGVVGAALLNRDGSFQYCYDFTPRPLYEGFRPLSEFLIPLPKSEGAPFEIGWIQGACLMVRASASQAVGVLDPFFDPLYSEDVDWCYRFKLAGWKIYHLPQAKVIHLGEVSKRRASKQRYERIYAKKAMFFRKHFGPATGWYYKLALFVANLLKSILWFILRPFGYPDARQEFEVHWNIVRRAFFF